MMKKALIAIAILLGAAVIVGVGVWLRGNTAPTTSQTGQLPGGSLPLPADNSGSGAGTGSGANGESGVGAALPTGTAAGGLALVSNAVILDYAVNSSGTILMATPAGALLESAASENITAQEGLSNVSGAWFSPDGNWLLVRSGSADAPRWSLLDTVKKVWRDIAASTKEMAWSPTGDQLAYFVPRTGGSALTVYDPKKNASKAVLTLAAPDLTFAWESASHILVMDRASAQVGGPIWDVTVAGGGMNLFADNVAGAQVTWGGPRGKGLLLRAAASGGVLSLVDTHGTALANFSFLTLPSKCVFGDVPTASSTAGIGDLVFCAVPQDATILRNHQLPDDYEKRLFGTSDAWYAINTFGGSIVALTVPSQTFAFDAMAAKVYGATLYFMNRNDKKLYRLPVTAGAAATPISSSTGSDY